MPISDDRITAADTESVTFLAREGRTVGGESLTLIDEIDKPSWADVFRTGNAIGRSIYRDYNKQLDIWNFDHRGSLNAVYAFLRVLGVRCYMPGELGEILPSQSDIALPKINRTVTPDWKVRSISRPLNSSTVLEDALWYLPFV